GVHHIAVQGMCRQLPFLKQNAVPQLNEQLTELVAHVVAEDFIQMMEEGGFGGCFQQRQGVMVHIQNTHFAKAAFDELRMDFGESTEVRDAPHPQFVHQSQNGGIIRHPERDGGVVKQPARVGFAFRELATCGFQLRDVVDYNQYPFPAFLVTRQDNAFKQNVQASTVQGVVDGLAMETPGARPKLFKLADVCNVHVVTQDRIQAICQLVKGVCAVEVERAQIHAQQPDTFRALCNSLRIFKQVRTQVDHSLLAPIIEKRLQFAIVFQPHRNGGNVEEVQAGLLSVAGL